MVSGKTAPLRNSLRPYEHVAIGPERTRILSVHRWYRNLAGGFTHPHAMDYMHRREILALTPAQLDYKLSHGSMARLPEGLVQK